MYDGQTTAAEVAESYLSAAEAAAVGRPLEQASLMPLKIYSSHAFFRREVEAVLRPGWHALAHVSQLQETGSYVTGHIVDEPVLVIRDKEGTIRALSNVCRHRGTQMLSNCGVAKLVVCPYHTWTYNLDGSLRGAPHMTEIPGFDRKAIKLPEFKVELWNGFVFVSLDPQAEPLAPQIAALTETLAPFNFADWESQPYMVRQGNWNWKASLENFSEAYHHVGIHRNSIGTVSKAENALYEDSNTNYSLFYVHIDHADGTHISGDAEFPFITPPNIPERYRSYSPIANIYPTFHLLMNTNFCLWLTIDVRGVNEHFLKWHWMLPPGSKALPDFQERLKGLIQLLEPVVTEDLEFLPLTKSAAQSRNFVPGHYSDQERCVHQMHQWLIGKLQARGALFAPDI